MFRRRKRLNSVKSFSNLKKSKNLVDEDSDLKYFEEKLGISGDMSANGKSMQKLKKELLMDGFDDEFLDFLDEVKGIKKTSENDVAELSSTEKVKEDKCPSNFLSAATSPTPVSLVSLLNRLSEGSMESVSLEIVKVIQQEISDANDFARNFFQLVVSSCSSLTLLGTLAASFVYISSIVSEKFPVALLSVVGEHLRKTSEEGVLAGVTKFVSLLFSFGLLPVSVLTDFASLLASEKGEKGIFLLPVLFRFSGKNLKRNFRSSFDLEISKAVNLLTGLQSTEEGRRKSKKIEFGISELVHMRDSNSASFPAMIHFEFVQEWLEDKKKKSKNFDRFPISFSENPFFQNISRQEGKKASSVQQSVRLDEISMLRKLAVQQKMNSEIRNEFFVAIASADDVVDATEKILRVSQFASLSGKNRKFPGSDFASLVVHFVLREKKYKSFYYKLIQAIISRIDCGKGEKGLVSVSIRKEVSSQLGKSLDFSGECLSRFGLFLGDLFSGKLIDLEILRFSGFHKLEKKSLKRKKIENFLLKIFIFQIFGNSSSEIFDRFVKNMEFLKKKFPDLFLWIALVIKRDVISSGKISMEGRKTSEIILSGVTLELNIEDD